ncbi:hypothetical protein [Kitasatospora mediocidica]|uniref:hypothetical protein n=1 Tax=Kitasatospora mediocidica TaxID=58352 RepID=UPI000AB65172|nr:hypothetical protein [Kitasatospora mediocidica]
MNDVTVTELLRLESIVETLRELDASAAGHTALAMTQALTSVVPTAPAPAPAA